MGKELMAEETFKTKRYAEIIAKIDRATLNDTGLRVLEEIEDKTKITKREVLLLDRMLEKTIFQKEDDVEVSVEEIDTIKAEKKTKQEQKNNERRRLRKEEEDEEKRKIFAVCFILGLIGVGIIGGIGSCVYWVNSLPDAEPKGVMDNPEIKQWMKKNMEKRGDRYYLK
jgi:hypothetical protein